MIYLYPCFGKCQNCIYIDECGGFGEYKANNFLPTSLTKTIENIEKGKYPHGIDLLIDALNKWNELTEKMERKENNMTYNPFELKDTTDMMLSSDYKERFKAEYYQLAIRYVKLKDMLDLWDKGELDFTPACNRGIYNFQIRAMGDYIAALESRAQIEGIELKEIK